MLFIGHRKSFVSHETDRTLSERYSVWIRVDVSDGHSRWLRFAHLKNQDQPFATRATAGCSTDADKPRPRKWSLLNKNSSFSRAASVEYRVRVFLIPFSESRVQSSSDS